MPSRETSHSVRTRLPSADRRDADRAQDQDEAQHQPTAGQPPRKQAPDWRPASSALSAITDSVCRAVAEKLLDPTDIASVLEEFPCFRADHTAQRGLIPRIGSGSDTFAHSRSSTAG